MSYEMSRARRILVVDDNPVNREVALHLLVQLGCEAQSVAGGQQALDAHRTQRFDLILMDCEMPGMDGYAAARLLRAEDSTGRTPILALTAHAGAGQEERCRQAGMDGVLSKPLRLPALRAALADLPVPAADVLSPSPHADEIDAVREVFGPDFPSLARLYLQDGPPRIAALGAALAAGEAASLGRIAHALGGSSASIGATGLSELCRKLEACAAAGRLDDAAARLLVVTSEFQRVIDKLDQLLRSSEQA